MKRYLQVLFLLMCSQVISASDRLAAEFVIKSGLDEVLSLTDVRGQVVLLFYEDPDSVEKNRPLKDYLNRYVESLPSSKQKNLRRLPVIDASPANWFTEGFWKESLQEHSTKNQMTIYADWTGKLQQDYRFKKDACNFVIIDQQGQIRFERVGRQVEQSSFEDIKKLLDKLINV